MRRPRCLGGCCARSYPAYLLRHAHVRWSARGVCGTRRVRIHAFCGRSVVHLASAHLPPQAHAGPCAFSPRGDAIRKTSREAGQTVAACDRLRSASRHHERGLEQMPFKMTGRRQPQCCLRVALGQRGRRVSRAVDNARCPMHEPADLVASPPWARLRRTLEM